MWSISLHCRGCFALYEAHFHGGSAYPTFFCQFCDSALAETAGWTRFAAGEQELTLRDLELIVVQGPLAEVRVWLDDDFDDRAAPAGWIQVATADEVMRLLDTRHVVELSLDHDLGDDEHAGRGIDVIDYLAEQQEVHGRNLWPRDGITLHTANPYGRDAMARSIRNYAGRSLSVEESRTPGGKPQFRFSPRR